MGWEGELHHRRSLLLRRAAARGITIERLFPAPHIGWAVAAGYAHDEVATRVAPTHGLSPDDWQAEVDLWLKRQLRGAELRVRMRSVGFEGFMSEGRYVTQFERPGVGAGAKHRAIRMLVEHTVLGVPPDCRPDDRPVYGYLSGSDESVPALQQYGPIVLHLRQSVRLRATFMGADSLDFSIHASLTDPSIVPAPIERPETTALPAHDIFLASHAPPRFDRRDVDPLMCEGLGDLTSYGYAEAQIHGGLSVEDLRAVTFTSNVQAPSQVLARLDELGVDWRTTAGDAP